MLPVAFPRKKKDDDDTTDDDESNEDVSRQGTAHAHKRFDGFYVVQLDPAISNTVYQFRCHDNECYMNYRAVPEGWEKTYHNLKGMKYTHDNYRLIHAPNGFTDKILHIEKNHRYASQKTWDTLENVGQQTWLGPFLIKCWENLRWPRVYLYGYRNLYDYGRAIKHEYITLDDHMLLGKMLQDILLKNRDQDFMLINDNADEEILHFDFRPAAAGATEMQRMRTPEAAGAKQMPRMPPRPEEAAGAKQMPRMPPRPEAYSAGFHSTPAAAGAKRMPQMVSLSSPASKNPQVSFSPQTPKPINPEAKRMADELKQDRVRRMGKEI